MKKLLVIVPVVTISILLAGCGSNSGNTPSGTGQGNFTNASLKGSYVYQIAGTDLSNNVPYRQAGILTADGNGNITTGTDDFAESANGLSTNSVSGTYSIANDGTGTMTLNYTNGSLNFGLTLVSANEFYMTEADSGVISSGHGLLQSSSGAGSTPTGTFVFRMHTNSAQGSSSLVGAVTVSGGSITGSDDVIRNGIFDNNTGGALALTGSMGVPNSGGRGTMSITDSSGATNNFIYYVIDSQNFKLMESDSGVIGIGAAQTQSGGPFSNGSLNGNYAFGSSGDDASALEAAKTVGVITTGGNGSISTGTLDSVVDGTNYGSIGLSGTYLAAPNGRAVVTLNEGSLGSVPQVYWMVSPSRVFFLTANTGKVEDGTMDKQTATSFSNSSLNGQYAFVMRGFTYSPLFLSRIGWINFTNSGNLTWNEAVNDSQNGPHAPGFLSGSYSVSGNGRGTATVNNLSVNQNDLIFYLVSGSQAYMLQNAPAYEIDGVMTLQ